MRGECNYVCMTYVICIRVRARVHVCVSVDPVCMIADIRDLGLVLINEQFFIKQHRRPRHSWVKRVVGLH